MSSYDLRGNKKSNVNSNFDAPPPQAPDAEPPLLTPEEAIRRVSSAVAPDFSFAFVGAFIFVTVFHESHPAVSAFVIILWLLVQAVGFLYDDDFQTNLVWNLIGLLGNLVFYLFIGALWSGFPKLYIDLWQHHLPLDLETAIRTCLGPSGAEGCTVTILARIKWYIVHWTITWPFSVLYTLTRDPLKIATDFIFEFSQQRYLAVMRLAIAEPSLHTASASPLWLLGTWFLAIGGYFVVGYAWSHLKLFIDVWQGTLPRNLQSEVDQLPADDEQALRAFVVRIKRLVVAWNVLWPFSVVYTILRHPLRILADFIYALSIKAYMRVVRKGREMHQKIQ